MQFGCADVEGTEWTQTITNLDTMETVDFAIAVNVQTTPVDMTPRVERHTLHE